MAPPVVVRHLPEIGVTVELRAMSVAEVSRAVLDGTGPSAVLIHRHPATDLAADREVTIFLSTDASNRSLSFPAGWKFQGGAAPSTLAASKTATLTLIATSGADSGVKATKLMDVRSVLQAAAQALDVTRCFEVETYTFPQLPGGEGRDDALGAALVRELRFARSLLDRTVRRS